MFEPITRRLQTDFGRLRRLGRISSGVTKKAFSSPKKFLLDLEYLSSDGKMDFVISGLPSFVPLNVEIDPSLESQPKINVLIPGLSMEFMSGGPNTAINLAYRMAEKGIPIRFISTCSRKERDDQKLWDHFKKLTNIDKLDNVELVCAADRRIPLKLGENDVFFATAWWTAQMINNVLPLFNKKKFIYMIQDFEPGLYQWSTEYALALETYSFDYFAIINSDMLANFMTQNRIGGLSTGGEEKDFVSFRPALDQRMFKFKKREKKERKQLAFYARPYKAKRNLFELGAYALSELVERGVIDSNWDIYLMGDQCPRLKLPNGIVAEPAGWMNYQQYADFLQDTDVALSLMLSPHPSYPPLEAASSGCLTVTNTYEGKSQEDLKAISENIIAVSPTAQGIIQGLESAISRVSDFDGREQGSEVKMPRNWEVAFEPILDKVVKQAHSMLEI